MVRMTYSIGILDGMLKVRANDGNGITTTSTSEKDIYGLIADFISRNYKVFKTSRSIVLRCGASTLRIENYRETLHDPRLSRLTKDILVSVKRNGYIDKSEATKVSRKPNRTKSQSYRGDLIKTGTTVLLMVGILSYTTLDRDSNNKTINRGSNGESRTIVEVVDRNIQTEAINFEFETKTLEESPVNYQFQDSIIDGETIDEMTEEKDIDECFLPIEDRFETPKAIKARNQYYDIICRMAKRYGLDPELLLAMATQEKGVHTAKIDAGGGYGIMQIQYKMWINDFVYCYKLNEQTGLFEQHKIKVTDRALKNVETNIEIGAAILQSYLSTFKYNIPLAVQAYNQGPAMVRRILKTYCANTGKEYNEVIRDPEDLGWTSYRYLGKGDPLYLEKVNSWVEKRDYTVINVHTYEAVEFRFNSNAKKI